MGEDIQWAQQEVVSKGGPHRAAALLPSRGGAAAGPHWGGLKRRAEQIDCVSRAII